MSESPALKSLFAVASVNIFIKAVLKASGVSAEAAAALPAFAAARAI